MKLRQWKFALLANFLALGAGEAVLRLDGFQFLPPGHGYEARSEALYLRQGPDFVESFARLGIGGGGERRFAAEREPSDLRIAVIGGSNAANFHDLGWVVGELGKTLHRRAQVLNYGVPSYGSARELLLLPEILSHGPDYLVVYAGHNEFEEDFLLRLHRSHGPLYRLDLALRSVRLYQATSWVVHAAGSRLLGVEMGSLAVGRGTLVPLPVRLSAAAQVADKELVYRRFAENLRDIVRVSRDAGTRVILATVVYSRLIPASGAEASPGFAEAKALYDRGDYARAKEKLEAMLDADRAPHRADRRINAITREVAAELNVPLIDLDAAAQRKSRGGIPDPDFLSDHCHLSGSGVSLFEEYVASVIERDLATKRR